MLLLMSFVPSSGRAGRRILTNLLQKQIIFLLIITREIYICIASFTWTFNRSSTKRKKLEKYCCLGNDNGANQISCIRALPSVSEPLTWNICSMHRPNNLGERIHTPKEKQVRGGGRRILIVMYSCFSSLLYRSRGWRGFQLLASARDLAGALL